jgi:uncharacterized protein YecT (DUF1311 family)
MTDDVRRPERGRRTTISHAPDAAPVASGPVTSSAATVAGRPDRRRLILLGVGAAVILGAVFALMMRPDLDRESRGNERAAQTEESDRSAPSFNVKAASEPYRAPDRDAISQAYAKAGQVFGVEGVSGLARYGLECFRTLEGKTTYRQLDYCLAFDAFGAAINQRVSGGQPAPPESYFGQASTRHLAVAEAAVGGEGDASARLTDIRRIAIEVARLSGPALSANANAAGGATAAAPPALVVAAPPAGAPQTAPAPTSAPPADRASQAPALAAAPAAPRPPPPPAQAAVASPAPTAQEVAAARPARAAGPSFNCRYARTAAERMICSRPDLAAADRRLNEAYEDAIAAGADRAALRLEQDRWLAIREGAAPDPDAVRDVYERRIEELRSGQ